jgi:CheY-like chemotaxis protein
LQEALANLILNAAEAMPRGGTITATTRADGASVIVEIKDTGEGMSHDVLVKCLEPFFSTKGVEGTGMGLTIVNNVIRRHGGTLDFKTEKGQGTTVILRLPAWNEDHREDSEDSLPVAITRALHILMIDDESWSRDIVSRMLSPDGHQIDVVASGEEGLEKLRIGSYDLVITDRAMPDMSGDDVAAEIRKKRPQMPIIMLTGFGDIMREEGDRPDSVDIVLSKPITSVALNQAISRLMHVKR